MRRAIWRHVRGHTDSLTHSLTHSLTYGQLKKPPRAGHRRSQDFFWGGIRLTPPSLASVVHTFEAVAGSRGSVIAPTVSRVMGGAPERNKNSKTNIDETTFGEGFL